MLNVWSMVTGDITEYLTNGLGCIVILAFHRFLGTRRTRRCIPTLHPLPGILFWHRFVDEVSFRALLSRF